MRDLASLSYPNAPHIIVQPPGPKAQDVIAKISQYIPHDVYAMDFPMVFEAAKGATAKDVDGNIYIELGAGFHVASTGFSHPKVVDAIQKAAEKLFAPPATWDFEDRYKAAQQIIDISPPGLDKVLYSSSGTEAVEAAIKIARYITKKTEVIAFHGHYHGKGYFAATLTTSVQHRDYGPYAIGAHHAPGPHCYRCAFKMTYPDCDLYCAQYVETVIKQECTYSGTNNVAAIICEPWARRGGTPKGWLPRIKQICEEHEILLIDDEITAGGGRSGKWWVCEHENVVPDLITAGKGLSSGVPVSFVMGAKKIMDQLPKQINEAQTFGMVPLAAAAVCATIDCIKNEKMLENVNTVGTYIQRRLEELKDNNPSVGDTPSLGFEWSMDLVADATTKTPLPREVVTNIFRRAWEQGILTYGAFTFFTPAFVLTQEHAETCFNIIEECLRQTEVS